MSTLDLGKTTDNRKNFHITVGTHPTRNLNLEDDIRLVKAALLYADCVKLYSLTSSMLWMVLRLGDIDSKQQLQFLEMIIPYISSKKDTKKTLAFLKRYKKMVGNKHPSPTERSLRVQFQNLLAEQWVSVKQTSVQIAKDAQTESIDCAIQSGLLELHTFKDTDNDETAIRFMADCVIRASRSPLLKSRGSELAKRDDNLIGEYVEEISNAVSDGSTYPLFDHLTSKLVEAGIREEKISVTEAAVSRGKHSGLAGHLLQRLPLFEQASVDEILDIRRELDKPLTRFRGAIVQFSKDIKSTSWDKDFPSDAEQVFLRDVEPAILDIEEAIKSNNYLKSLARQFVDKPLVLPAGSVLSVIMSQLSSLPDEVAQSLGIGVSSAALIYDAYNEWKKKKQEIEQNHLYFYYQARKLLSK